MIKIIDNYYYDVDGTQYTLYYKGSRNKIDIKTKKATDEIIEFTDTVGYFTSIKTMVKACIKHSAMSNAAGLETIKEYLDYIKQLEDKLEEALS